MVEIGDGENGVGMARNVTPLLFDGRLIEKVCEMMK